MGMGRLSTWRKIHSGYLVHNSLHALVVDGKQLGNSGTRGEAVGGWRLALWHQGILRIAKYYILESTYLCHYFCSIFV